MPIYEYACDACGHEFEKLVRMSAEPPPCPECGADVRKKVSASGFILKGGGWYKDHYGLKGGSSAKSDSSASAGSSDSGSSGSSDSKASTDSSSGTKSTPSTAPTSSE